MLSDHWAEELRAGTRRIVEITHLRSGRTRVSFEDAQEIEVTDDEAQTLLNAADESGLNLDRLLDSLDE